MAQDTRANQETSQTTPNKSAAPSGASTAARDASDRQRNITTIRDTGSAMNRSSERLPGRSMANDPYSVMQRMADDMDRLFTNFGFPRLGLGLSPSLGIGTAPRLWQDSSADAQSLWSPHVEVFRRDNNIVVRADLPGLKKEDIDIEIENDMLTISGERHDEQTDRRDGYYRSERHYGQFLRTVALPEGADDKACKASFDNGVLEITIPAPKEEAKKARQVEIH